MHVVHGVACIVVLVISSGCVESLVVFMERLGMAFAYAAAAS